MQGHWALSYDPLNRLRLATTPVAIMGGVSGLCWQYDSFGNRLYQNLGSSAFSGGGTGACSGGGTVTSNYEPVNAANQIQSSSNAVVPGGGGFTSAAYHYDAAGNLINDGSAHSYAYDAEGRVCAEATTIIGTGTVYYGYLYDAEGRRVAKGTISGGSLDGSGNVTAATCNLSTHEFTVTSSYVLGPDGSTMTELDGSANWVHTDVPAGPGAMAVYDGSGLHFRLSDWLGSHRVQTSVDAATVEDTYQNLPFGEILNSPLGATTKHFTGKEHDDESGNDYFGARYLNSSIGRWAAPDMAGPDIQNPQTLNKYRYALNNPLRYTDPDGRYEADVHYDLTRVLAYAAGFAWDGTAQAIAHGDQNVDDDPATNPMNITQRGAENIRALYHFTTPERRMELLNSSDTPGAFGVFMHAEQDSFSHEGFGPERGHLSAGHDPDHTYADPEKADRMALDTYKYLLGANFGRDAVAIDYEQIEHFVHAFNRATSDKDKANALNNMRGYVMTKRNQSKNKKKTSHLSSSAACSAENHSCSE